jgi:hypothetical protein
VRSRPNATQKQAHLRSRSPELWASHHSATAVAPAERQVERQCAAPHIRPREKDEGEPEPWREPWHLLPTMCLKMEDESHTHHVKRGHEQSTPLWPTSRERRKPLTPAQSGGYSSSSTTLCAMILLVVICGTGDPPAPSPPPRDGRRAAAALPPACFRQHGLASGALGKVNRSELGRVSAPFHMRAPQDGNELHASHPP